jgi:adenylate cyclase
MANSILPESLKRRVSALLALVLTLAFAWLAINNLDFTNRTGLGGFLTAVEMRALDVKFQIRGARPGASEIVIVGVDDRTIKKLGSARLFQRSNFATLVDKIAEGKPKAVGFDISFEDKDASSSENDTKLAKSVEGAKSVVLGLISYFEKTQGPKRRLDTLDPEMQQLVAERQIFAVESNPNPATNFHRASDVKRNLPELTKAAAYFGFLNFALDTEGKLRYQPQVVEYNGRLYPSLDLQLLRLYLNTPLSVTVNEKADGHIESVQVGDYNIPTDDFGRVMIDYSGPAGTYQTLSMVDVMEGQLKSDVFKDKIVLIGAPTIGLNDVVATPFGPDPVPGVELHANFIDNVLHGRYLYRNSTLKLIDLGLIIVFGLVLGLLLPRMNAARSVVYMLMLISTFSLFNLWAFLQLKWVLSWVYPFVSIVVTSGSLISYKYLGEEREKKRTKQTFQSYLDQHVVEQVLNNPDMLKLGGEKRDLTVLFSDIRGFTSFSERMGAEEVVHFLNQYFEKMQAIIFKHQGTLDKLIGDAVMCFWGAPIETKDHALRGVMTALEMIRAVEDLRGVLVLPGGAKFDIGIGLNTGPMVFGNMGSPTRLSYTIMGDNVNLGSRLESLNKYYGTNILIADSTFNAVKERIFCRQLDTIQVKGKTQAVTIYEPLGLKRLEFDRRRKDRRGEMTLRKRIIKALVLLQYGERRKEDRRLGSPRLLVRPEQEEIATMYEHALTLYRNGDFEAADLAFDHVMALKPGDGPSSLMKSRIAKYRKEAGAESHFDPVYKFDEK